MTGAKNVLHVSAWDAKGGSARSAYRIHNGLKESGLVSRMIVGDRITDDPDVKLIAESRWLRAADWVFRKAQNLTSLQYVAFPSSWAFLRDSWVQDADIVQLYNIHGNYFSFNVLPALTSRKTVVWRLSDMWPLTGHCSYSYECERWKSGCGACPHLDEFPSLRRDTTALLYRMKERAYRESRLTLVAPTRWMEGLVKASPLLSRFPVHVVPNGVDTDFFHPMGRAAARRELRVPSNRPVIALMDPGPGGERKGRAMLGEIADRLTSGGQSDFIVFGVGSSEWSPRPGIHLLGALEPAGLRTALAAADMFLFPSAGENLANVVLESLSCGTPVVTFPSGGLVEAIRPGVNGEIVHERTAGALTAVAQRLLLNPDALQMLGEGARRTAESDFSRKREIGQFIELYRSMDGIFL